MWASGAANRGWARVGGLAAGCAHSEQNFADAESWEPQFAHARARGAAHSSQNFAPSRFWCWHCGHLIGAPQR